MISTNWNLPFLEKAAFDLERVNSDRKPEISLEFDADRY